ncbi:hypothetical protein KUTeg_022832 [Tegillarca granosa]|uniref:Uncharacterized protein n=1 Tax=Tegillarca granosa TaxID=220873 RepID=A0ABQ9E4H7_TEGGR|nr:hypothetical protein KUTeg_022832 [Tegillarca granosa]
MDQATYLCHSEQSSVAKHLPSGSIDTLLTCIDGDNICKLVYLAFITIAAESNGIMDYGTIMKLNKLKVGPALRQNKTKEIHIAKVTGRFFLLLKFNIFAVKYLLEAFVKFPFKKFVVLCFLMVVIAIHFIKQRDNFNNIFNQKMTLFILVAHSILLFGGGDAQRNNFCSPSKSLVFELGQVKIVAGKSTDLNGAMHQTIWRFEVYIPLLHYNKGAIWFSSNIDMCGYIELKFMVRFNGKWATQTAGYKRFELAYTVIMNHWQRPLEDKLPHSVGHGVSSA